MRYPENEEIEARLVRVEGLLIEAFWATAAAEGNRYPPTRLASTALGAVLAAADEETLRAAAVWAHRISCGHAGPDWVRRPWQVMEPIHQIVTTLARRKLRWTLPEARWAFLLTLKPPPVIWVCDEWRLPIAIAERLAPSQRAEITDLIERTVDLVEAANATADERARALRRLYARSVTSCRFNAAGWTT